MDANKLKELVIRAWSCAQETYPSDEEVMERFDLTKEDMVELGL